ncbi:transposase [Staphylococcus delphini]|nr:transposase [Staphylococcus delphini]
MDGLIDGRGRGKPRSTISQEEVKKAEIRALKGQNRLLQIENEVLKKYHEIEREMIQKVSKSSLTKPSKHKK